MYQKYSNYINSRAKFNLKTKNFKLVAITNINSTDNDAIKVAEKFFIDKE